MSYFNLKFSHFYLDTLYTYTQFKDLAQIQKDPYA